MTDPYGGAQPEPTGAPSGGMSGVLGGPSSESQAIVDSARGVRDDFQYGDDRVILNPPNWASQSSMQLYHGAVTGNDPGLADAMGQSWHHHGTELRHVADTIYEAITELSGVWVGEASAAAQGALIGVANASGTAGDAARTMGQRMSQQAAAAAEVKKMPPPKDFDYNTELDKLLSGHPAAMSATDLKAELDAAQAVRAEQQRYMDEYTRAMSEIDGATPSFGPESIGMKPVNGSYASGQGVGPGGSMNVVGGGASLTGAQGTIGAATAAGVPNGVPAAGGANGGSFAGGNLGQPTSAPVPPGSAAAYGTSAVTAQASGPSAAGLAGGAALGAGAGLAGARALAKGGRKRRAAREEQPEAVEAAPTEATEAQPAEQEYAEPHTGELSQPGQPLAAGATTGVASGATEQHAGQVAASTDDGAAAQAVTQQQQQHLNAQAAGQGGAVAPMQPHPPASGGGGAGAAGVDTGDTEHEQPSYLIEPDPDDVFGPTDRATTGVIGAEFEDD
ncbi:MAG: hypothetical protein GEV00_10505 [Actinophytocola sp.]|nr:hypothetical protein [Actinophytocola sp.]